MVNKNRSFYKISKSSNLIWKKLPILKFNNTVRTNLIAITTLLDKKMKHYFWIFKSSIKVSHKKGTLKLKLETYEQKKQTVQVKYHYRPKFHCKQYVFIVTDIISIYIMRIIYTFNILIYIYSFIIIHSIHSIHLYIYTSMHLYIYTSMHLYIYTSIHLCIYTSIHIYI